VRKVEELARLVGQRPGQRIAGRPATCPVCNEPPTTPSRYDPTPYCPRCLGSIMPALTQVRSWEKGFGTEWI
jgi:hypothetical protein